MQNSSRSQQRELSTPTDLPPAEDTPPPDPAPFKAKGSSLYSGLRVLSLCTVASRVLGLLRDMAMAARFGNGPILDAFTLAFRVPNMARQLFGEGALTAAFLPAFVREHERRGQRAAWELATALLNMLAMFLAALVLTGELVLGGIHWLGSPSPDVSLLIGLIAVMLPYLALICLAAQVGTVLQALGHFTWPALLSVLMNVIWIAGIWFVAPIAESKTTQIYIIAACILVSGIVQLVAPLPTLRRLGFVYMRSWLVARWRVVTIARNMVPVLIGLSITQVNTLSDSVIGWAFARPENGATHMSLPGRPAYPFKMGTTSALYFGQRLYQFPLGVFGVALGTVLFPLLSRHAGQHRFDLLRDDLVMGLRLVLAIGVPASAGLVVLARPLTALLFQHHAFDVDDVNQTAGMTAAYGMAVWAYCGLLIVHRGYYSVGDRMTPLRVGLLAVFVNLALNLTLIWFMGGVGLAFSTAVAAILQVSVVTWLIQQRIGRLDWSRLIRTAIAAMSASAVMAVACVATLHQLPESNSLYWRLVRVAVPFAVSLVVFTTAARLLGLHELWRFLKQPAKLQLSDANFDDL